MIDNIIIRVVQAVHHGLDNAEVIAAIPDERMSEARDGYWERVFIVVWRRPIPEGMSRLGTDGYSYATHRVHVNSDGDSACFMGHYDMPRDEALLDMFDRAKLGPIHEAERLRAEWRKADDGWITCREELAKALGQTCDNPADPTHKEDDDA